jgi:ZIP family zinc transporter
MLSALLWGAVAASSLVLGALLAFAYSWPDRAVGIVLSFGAGALISAIAFELAQEGAAIGDPGITAIGLGVGAITYYVADGLLERRSISGRQARTPEGAGAGPALALGAFLDGIPEQAVLGIGLASGEGVSLALLVAIFVSNLPEAIGSAAAMEEAGSSRRSVMGLWAFVAACCVAATGVGWAIADVASPELRGAIDGFAAGALLVMLIDSMAPEARKKAGRVAGLVTALGFALAAGLSYMG